jgi:polysaccharide biosynthesis protein PslG
MMHAARVRRSLLLTIAVALCGLAGAAPARAMTIGIAEQRPGMFHDRRVVDLVRHARLSVAWDAMQYDWQRRELDTWMTLAKATQIAPLVTFGRSRTKKFSLPKADVYRREVLRFRRRYPQVREYSPWNEPNLAIQPANYDPARIASYYRVLRRMCPKCKVLGADVVDTSSLERWMRSYLREFPRDRRPKLWGLHNYVDVNSASSWGTQTMRKFAPGEIWFTETGAIVRRTSPTATGGADRRLLIRTGGGSRAVAATKRVFSLAETSPRITRVYIYHWKATREGSWDSALVAPDGTTRASFAIFAEEAQRALAAPPEPEPEPAPEPAPVPVAPNP